MSLTLPELCEKLKEMDEISLLEKLEITSEDLIDRFIDEIEDRFDSLEQEYDIEKREYD